MEGEGVGLEGYNKPTALYFSSLTRTTKNHNNVTQSPQLKVDERLVEEHVLSKDGTRDFKNAQEGR